MEKLLLQIVAECTPYAQKGQVAGIEALVRRSHRLDLSIY